MNVRRRFAVAAAMAVGWTCILLAGADWPPPRGFAWAALLACAAGAVTYARARSYGLWAASRRKGRFLRVLAEGLGAGLAVAAALLLIRGLALQLADAAAWLAAVGGAGMVHTGLSYALLAK